MDAWTQHLIEQLRTGLIQPEELTELEVIQMLSLAPTAVPVEVALRVRAVADAPHSARREARR